jgi:hypothetical protein
MMWRIPTIRVPAWLMPWRVPRTPPAARRLAAPRSQEHARALIRQSSCVVDAIDDGRTGRVVVQGSDAATVVSAPQPAPAIEAGDSQKASLSLRLLDAFELAGARADTLDEQLRADASQYWPRTFDRLMDRSTVVVAAAPQAASHAAPRTAPAAGGSPQTTPPRSAGPVVSTAENSTLARSLLQLYELGIKRANSHDRPLTAQEKREWMQRSGAAVKFCLPGDWVAIECTEPGRAGHYVVPNPFTASVLPVEKLKKFYSAMDSSEMRSRYKLTKPTWVGAPVLENAKFDIDEVEQTWRANGDEGKVERID